MFPSIPTPADDDSRGNRRFYLAVTAALIVLAFGLRVYHLGRQHLWLDETASVFWIQAEPFNPIRNGAFYYLLLDPWIELFGSGESALRFPSALFGTLFVGAVIWWAKEMFDSRTALWTGLFTALSPIHIYYSQEARTYALTLLLIALAYPALWRALKYGLLRDWIIYAGCAFLAILSHHMAVLSLAPSLFLLWLSPGTDPIKRRLLPYSAATFPAAVLFLTAFIHRIAQKSGPEWISFIWQHTPPLLAIPKSLEVFALGSEARLLPLTLKQFDVVYFSPALRTLGLALFAIILLYAALPFGDARTGIPSIGRRRLWSWVLLLFPLLALWLPSFFKPMYVAGRYDMMAFPAFVLLLGLGMVKIQTATKVGPFIAAGVAFGCVLVVGAKLWLYHDAFKQTNFKQTAAMLHSSVANGDVVVFTGLQGLPTLYYLSRLGYVWEGAYCSNAERGRKFGCRMFPRDIEQRPASYVKERVSSSPEELKNDVRIFLEQLDGPNASLWILFEQKVYLRDRQRLELHNPNLGLVKELHGHGFSATVVLMPGVPDILRFRKP